MQPIQSVNAGNTGTNATGGTQLLGKDDFMQLLIVKLQNQDPLKPMEDEDFIAQLASFSSLEQMNNIAGAVSQANDLSFLQMQALNNAMAAGFVGKDVKASYSTIFVEEGATPRISYTLEQHAEQVTIRIKGSDGQTVATLKESNVGVGPHTVEWDGRDSLGNKVASGEYTIAIEAVGATGETVSPKLSLVGTVDAVIYRDGLSYLRVGDMEIPLGDITAIGEQGVFDED
jgi:flagellar basal-body rod modification protein FlgD